MRINDPKLIGALAALGVEHEAGVSLADKTSLEIGGTSDLLLILRHHSLPELVRLLKQNGVPYHFLGGGSNVLLPDGELPWVVLQLERLNTEVRIEGNSVQVYRAATGRIESLRGSEINFEYRHTSFAPDAIM